jgi:transcriptional regulator with XRE-family HTH domain
MARKEFRRMIQTLRKSKQWSQRKLAAAAQVSQATIALIESGDRQPSLAVLRRLAKALGVPPARLLG